MGVDKETKNTGRNRKTKVVKKQNANVDVIPESDAPVKQKELLKRKLQWPPDHSDVCSEAELAAHDEIIHDIRKINALIQEAKHELLDQSTSEYSTTETPEADIENVIRKRDLKRRLTTTDTEGSGNESQEIPTAYQCLLF